MQAKKFLGPGRRAPIDRGTFIGACEVVACLCNESVSGNSDEAWLESSRRWLDGDAPRSGGLVLN